MERDKQRNRKSRKQQRKAFATRSRTAHRDRFERREKGAGTNVGEKDAIAIYWTWGNQTTTTR